MNRRSFMKYFTYTGPFMVQMAGGKIQAEGKWPAE